MLLPALTVLLSTQIVLAALAWGWRNGTLHVSEQERVDMEFDRIVRRFRGRVC